jgi:hypothetical protein
MELFLLGVPSVHEGYSHGAEAGARTKAPAASHVAGKVVELACSVQMGQSALVDVSHLTGKEAVAFMLSR